MVADAAGRHNPALGNTTMITQFTEQLRCLAGICRRSGSNLSYLERFSSPLTDNLNMYT